MDYRHGKVVHETQYFADPFESPAGRRPGVATGFGVEATARQMYELSFNATLALDAMTDGRRDAHE